MEKKFGKMKRINKYDKFNEGLFTKNPKKSFERYLDDIDDLFLLYEESSGKSIRNKYANKVYDSSERGDYLAKSVNYMARITDKLDAILMEHGRRMDQEMMDRFVKRFNAVGQAIVGTGYILKNYNDLNKVRDNMNAILNLLDHIRKFYDLKVDVDEKKYNNPLVFWKHEGFFYTVHKSFADKKDKEAKELHANVDPYGEEDWGDEEPAKNEGVKWYRGGDLGDEENIEVEEPDFITNYYFRQFLIENGIYEIYIKYCSRKDDFKSYFTNEAGDIINTTLSWGSTPVPGGGRDIEFWERMRNKWRAFYKKNKDIVDGK
jgi:hypothetical protein